MTLALGKVNGKILVACGTCGARHYIPPRTLRDQRVNARLPMCRFCRHPAEVQAQPEHRKAWIDQFPIGEIVEMAEAIWGPRERWEPIEAWSDLIPWEEFEIIAA